VIELELLPGLGELVRAQRRLVGMRREHARIDGSHGGAAEDVDRKLAPEVTSDLVEDVLDDPHLVRASRGTASQDERHESSHDFIVTIARSPATTL
jgi:hypothetical protein